MPDASVAVVLLTLGLGLVAVARARPVRLVGVAIAAYAAVALAAAGRLADRLPSAAGQVEIDVAGWVDGFPAQDPDRTVFTFETAPTEHRCKARGGSDQPVDSGACVPSRLRLSWYEPPFPLEPGMSLALTVRVRPPRGLSNPGGFDYERWLFAESIGATGYVLRGRAEPGAHYGVAQRLLTERHELAVAIRQRVDDFTAATLLTALGLGVRSDFTDRDWEVLRRTGTTHLVAISGLHIGLVAVVAFQILLRSLIRLPAPVARRAWTIAASLALVPAVAYAALAGFALPTLRALLMLGVAQGVVLSRRRIRPFAGVALALLVILATDPLATLLPSFWLSFGAVAVIVCFVVRRPGAPAIIRSGRRQRFAAATIALARLQLAVMIGLMPLTAAFFGQISLAGLPVNLVAVPAFSFALVPASLFVVAAVMTGFAVGTAVAVAAPLAAAAWRLLEMAADWPAAALAVGTAPGIAIAAVGAVWFIACRTSARWLGLVGLPCLLLGFMSRPPEGTFDLTVLDVGHGLAVVVRTATHTLLYDTGPLSRGGFDAGDEIVVPALRRLSPGQLDLIVVSHGDADHAGGLTAVQRAEPDASLLTGPDLPVGEPCREGRRWRWDGVDFTVLHPEDDALTGNDSSCVVLVSAPGGRLLLTGDIETVAEEVLVARGLPAVDVVVAPHHGSATSSSAAFVAATRPAVVIVSAGHDNRWGFPRPDVVRRWHRVGADVVTTGETGAVTIEIADRGVRVETRRETHVHYWSASSGAGRSSAL